MKLARYFLISALGISFAYAIPGQFGVGIQTNNYFGSSFFTDSYVGTVDYFYKDFATSFQIGGYNAHLAYLPANQQNYDTKENILNYNISAGLRNALNNDTSHAAYFTYGLIYSAALSNSAISYGGSTTQKINNSMVGAYIGLDYKLTTNLQLMIKALPYNRTFYSTVTNPSANGDNKSSTSEFFNRGSIGLSYLF